MRLFLSYPHDNADLALELARLIRSGGHDIWTDHQLRVGREWKAQLREQIQRSDGIVLALMPSWMASPYCQWEFVTAVEAGKRVIPVMLVRTELPNRISRYQYADFTKGFADEKANQSFLDDILSLATVMDDTAITEVNRTDIERSIDQHIALGDIHGSSITTSQSHSGSRPNTSRQDIKTGDIHDSIVNIDLSSTVKQANWRLYGVLILALLIVIMLAAVVTLLPEPQRNTLLYSIGLVGPSMTPPPTATATSSATPTRTPTLPPSPTPTLQPAAEGEFLVIVAEFRKNNTERDPAIQIYRALESAVEQVGNNVRLEFVDRPITSKEEARNVRNASNASLVIYGDIDDVGLYTTFISEITDEFPVQANSHVTEYDVDNYRMFVHDGVDADFFFWLTVGQFLFYNRDYDGAINALYEAETHLENVMHPTREIGEDIMGAVSSLYYFRGLSHVRNGYVYLGSEDLQQASDLDPVDVFSVLPLDESAIHWIQYFGNTQAAYRWRNIIPDGYMYSQGLSAGLDFFVQRGAPVRAGVDGVVLDIRRLASSHSFDVIVGVGGFEVHYMHIEPANIEQGQAVSPNSILGTAGVLREHFHLEVRHYQTILNPLTVMPNNLAEDLIEAFPPVEPRGFMPGDRWQTALEQPVIVIFGPLINTRIPTD